VARRGVLRLWPQRRCPDASAWLAEFPNLVVVRATFSKAYGLAGLRIGYGLSHPQVAELLNRVRQPFNVNRGKLAAASAALEASRPRRIGRGTQSRGHRTAH